MRSNRAPCVVHLVALDRGLADELRQAQGFAGVQWREHSDLEALGAALAGDDPSPARVMIAAATRAQLHCGWHARVLDASPQARVAIATRSVSAEEERELVWEGACTVLRPPWPVLGALSAFRDLAYLSALFPGSVVHGRRELHELTLPTRRELLPGVIQLLCERFDSLSYPLQMVRGDLPLVIDEAVTNAMGHGNGWDPAKVVHLRLELDAEGFTLQVEDQGEGFARDAVPSPLAPENRMRGGGRGLFLMESLVDEVRYEEGGRRIVLRKRLAPLLEAGPRR
jgi:anti-sigma regulatory factor (Ser/Thr protein kinase)